MLWRRMCHAPCGHMFNTRCFVCSIHDLPPCAVPYSSVYADLLISILFYSSVHSLSCCIPIYPPIHTHTSAKDSLRYYPMPSQSLVVASGRMRPLALLLTLVAVMVFIINRYMARAGDGSGSSKPRSKRKTYTSPKKERRSPRSQADSHRPTIIICVGMYGSGKTTWASLYVQQVHKSYRVISSDAIRLAITGSPTNYDHEEQVEEAILSEVARYVRKERSFIVDDCSHNLRPEFRQKLLQLAPAEVYNRIMRVFSIRPTFAAVRIEKDLAAGKQHYVPTVGQLDLQDQSVKEAEQHALLDGWIIDK